MNSLAENNAVQYQSELELQKQRIKMLQYVTPACSLDL